MPPTPIKLADGPHTFTVTMGPNAGQTTAGHVSNNGNTLTIPGPAMVPLVFQWQDPPKGYKHTFWEMWVLPWKDSTWDLVRKPDHEPLISDTSGTFT